MEILDWITTEKTHRQNALQCRSTLSTSRAYSRKIIWVAVIKIKKLRLPDQKSLSKFL